MKVSALLFTAPLLLGANAFRPMRAIRHIESTEELITAPDGSDQTGYNNASLPLEFAVPYNHFPSSSRYAPNYNGTFNIRYWVNSTYYKPGGPVILFLGGEGSAQPRNQEWIQTRISGLLAQETNGVAVILEQRYFGASIPDGFNLTTDEYRFSSTEQALADMNLFATTVNLTVPGYENETLTAPTAQWISYGGSYPGAQSAFLRHLYPSTFYGSIASSSVTLAQTDFWQIAEPIRAGAPDCAVAFADRMALVDYVLTGSNTTLISQLKTMFGMENVTYAADVGGQLSQYTGMLSWQSRHWNPALNDPTFDDICDIVEQSQSAIGRSAISDPATAFANGTAWNALAGWANFTADYIVNDQCGDEDQNFCLGQLTWDAQTFNASQGLAGISWYYLTCTEFGFWQNHAPSNYSKPSLISQTQTNDYWEQTCRNVFPDGQYNKVGAYPNNSLINQYGAFNIKADRLAYIGGQYDDWRYVTPFNPNSTVQHANTTLRPFYLIPNSVHAWDNSVLSSSSPSNSTPQYIIDVHNAEINWVKSWLSANSTST